MGYDDQSRCPGEVPAGAAQGKVTADPGARAEGDRENSGPLVVGEVMLGVDNRGSEEDGAPHALPRALVHAARDSPATESALRQLSQGDDPSPGDRQGA